MLFPGSIPVKPRPQLPPTPQPRSSGSSAPPTSVAKSWQSKAISGDLNSNQTVLPPLLVTVSDTNTGSPNKYAALSVVNCVSTLPANKAPGNANPAKNNVINGFNIAYTCRLARCGLTSRKTLSIADNVTTTAGGATQAAPPLAEVVNGLWTDRDA